MKTATLTVLASRLAGFHSSDKIICDGELSHRSITFHFPNNIDCTVNCIGRQACQSARLNCPSSGYQCNIICSDPFSCNSLRITIGGGGFQSSNDRLQCCEDLSCMGVSTVPTTSHQCYYTQDETF